MRNKELGMRNKARTGLNLRLPVMAAAVLAVTALLGACVNHEDMLPSHGMGRVRITVAAAGERTLLPDTGSGLEYRLAITKNGAGAPAVNITFGGDIWDGELEPGGYTVVVTVFKTGVSQAVMRGSEDFSVSPDSISSVNVQLSTFQTSSGVFSYTVNIRDVTLISCGIQLESFSEEGRGRDPDPIFLTGGSLSGSINVFSGYYRAVLEVIGTAEGIKGLYRTTAAAYIADGLTTSMVYDLTKDDFNYGEFCTLRFDLNYTGAGEAATQELVYNMKITEPLDPVRTGWTFDGWYTDTSFTARWNFDTGIVTGNFSLYAKWLHTVTFDLNYDAAPVMAAQGVNNGDKVTKPSPDPVRVNWIFGGWHTDSAALNAWDFDTGIVTGSMTLYAKWDIPVIPLDTWQHHTLQAGEIRYYRFLAAARYVYDIFWNDSFQGNGTKTANIKVSASFETSGLSIFGGIDSAWEQPRPISAAGAGYIVLRVEGLSAGDSGTYAIKYCEYSGVRPTNIGMGINLLGPLNGSSISPNQILDRNKLNAADGIAVTDEARSLIYAASGEQMADVQVSSNTALGMGAAPFKTVTFSGGMASAFASLDSEYNEYKWAAIRGEHYTKAETLKSDYRSLLYFYFTDSFIHALQNENPAQFFQRYGHALVLNHYWGGIRELYIKYLNSANMPLDAFRGAVNADIQMLAAGIGAETRTDFTPNAASVNWQADSEMRGRGNSGDFSTFTGMDQFYADYSAWVSSVSNNPVFAGIPNYTGSLIPVWEIARDLGYYEAADRLQGEFINQAIALAGELDGRLSGEWVKLKGEREYLTAGTSTFTLPTQYTTIDESGTTQTAIVRYVFYVAGGGAGGNGHSSWGNSGDLSGGAGAGGALIKIRFKSGEGITAAVTAGAGGTPGTEMRDHAWPGPGVSSGDDSTVTLYGQTFTAGGGQPSPYSDYGYHYGPGGVGSPLEPPAFVDEYIIANGGATNGVWNQPGAGGAIDIFSAGKGGNGSTGNNGQHGGNGWVRVRWYFYDGQ